MILESNKNKGRFGLAMAIAYFTSEGYTISTPLNDTQWYDLIISGNMYVIPMSEIVASGNTKQITLRTEPTANNQGFQTYKFRVQFSFQAS